MVSVAIHRTRVIVSLSQSKLLPTEQSSEVRFGDPRKYSVKHFTNVIGLLRGVWPWS